MRYKVTGGAWIELVEIVRTLAENRLDVSLPLEIELFAKAVWYGDEQVLPAIRSVLDDSEQPHENKRRLLYLVDTLRRFTLLGAKPAAEIRFLLYEFGSLKCAKTINCIEKWGIAAELPKVHFLCALSRFVGTEYANNLGIKGGQRLIKTRRQIADEIADAKRLPRVPHDAHAADLALFVRSHSS